METSMPSTKKSRAKKLSRPAADASCILVRTVERSGLRLGVWSCSSPSPGEPLEEAPCVKVAPVVAWIGGLDWRFWYVSRGEAERDQGEGWGCSPGWWYKAVDANPHWATNVPIGPFATIEKAFEDAQAGAAAGGY
jgi:hypothetical protein